MNLLKYLISLGLLLACFTGPTTSLQEHGVSPVGFSPDQQQSTLTLSASYPLGIPLGLRSEPSSGTSTRGFDFEKLPQLVTLNSLRPTVEAGIFPSRLLPRVAIKNRFLSLETQQICLQI